MKEIQLVYSSTYSIHFNGKDWNFIKEKYQRVPEVLADRLLATGDFMEIIHDELFIAPELPKKVIPVNNWEKFEQKQEKSVVVKKKRGRRRKNVST